MDILIYQYILMLLLVLTIWFPEPFQYPEELPIARSALFLGVFFNNKNMFLIFIFYQYRFLGVRNLNRFVCIIVHHITFKIILENKWNSHKIISGPNSVIEVSKYL